MHWRVTAPPNPPLYYSICPENGTSGQSNWMPYPPLVAKTVM